MSMTGWMLYGPGEAWVEDLVDGPWELEAATEPAGGWHGAFFVHSHEQPGEVEGRLRALSGRAAIPMLACYVETSDFGYALALGRGELVGRYVVNAHSADIFVEGVWALEQCVALHGRDWQQTAVEALASWSVATPRPLTTSQLNAILAGRHLFPEAPLSDAPAVLYGPRPSASDIAGRSMCLTETRFPRGSVRAGRDHDRVRTRAIHPGDLVLVSKRGRLFYARVLGAGATGGLAGRRGLSRQQPSMLHPLHAAEAPHTGRITAVA